MATIAKKSQIYVRNNKTQIKRIFTFNTIGKIWQRLNGIVFQCGN